MKYNDLKKISDEELIELHDKRDVNTIYGTQYYLDELARRSNEKINRQMLKFTRWITAMTAIMLLSTIVNVVIAIIR